MMPLTAAPCLAQQGPVSQRRSTCRPMVPGMKRKHETAMASRYFATFVIPLVDRMTFHFVAGVPYVIPRRSWHCTPARDTPAQTYSFGHVSDPCEQGDWWWEVPVTKASLFRKERHSMLTLTRISRKAGRARRGGRGGRQKVPSLTIAASLQNSFWLFETEDAFRLAAEIRFFAYPHWNRMAELRCNDKQIIWNPIFTK